MKNYFADNIPLRTSSIPFVEPLISERDLMINNSQGAQIFVEKISSSDNSPILSSSPQTSLPSSPRISDKPETSPKIDANELSAKLSCEPKQELKQ